MPFRKENQNSLHSPGIDGNIFSLSCPSVLLALLLYASIYYKETYVISTPLISHYTTGALYWWHHVKIKPGENGSWIYFRWPGKAHVCQKTRGNFQIIQTSASIFKICDSHANAPFTAPLWELAAGGKIAWKSQLPPVGTTTAFVLVWKNNLQELRTFGQKVLEQKGYMDSQTEKKLT